MHGRKAWRWAAGLGAAGLLTAAAWVVVSAWCAPSPLEGLAFGAMAADAASGVLVSATPLGDSEVVVCLVDTQRQRLVAYVIDAKRSRMKLVAARDIGADWALTDFNNDPPLPKDVRARAERATEGKPDASP